MSIAQREADSAEVAGSIQVIEARDMERYETLVTLLGFLLLLATVRIAHVVIGVL